MQSEKTNNKQLQSTGLWNNLIGLFLSFFKSTPVERAEASVIKTDDMVDKAKAKAEVERIKKASKAQRGINRKIGKAKEAFPVEKLKVGKLVYITNSEGGKKEKVIYAGYDGEFIYDQQGNNYSYNKVYSWHGKPIAEPSLIKN